MTYIRPPYTLTNEIFDKSLQIQQILGELKSFELAMPSLKLRRENKIKTIHHSLAIEGNSLTLDQITAILENKRIIGPKNQINEVLNAIKVYDNLFKYAELKESDLKNSHKILMQDLIKTPGNYRTTNVGILKGTQVGHIAPQPKFVSTLMKNLFLYLKDKSEKSFLIKACVFHYEIEFIHPFEDGNGRIGRLWQQLILMKHSEVFQYLPVESLIHKNQKSYYQILEKCDKTGDSTLFIEFSLGLILKSLEQFQKDYRPNRILSSQRIDQAEQFFKNKEFVRLEYLKLFPKISTATASRDLAEAVNKKIFSVVGDKRSAKYKIKK